MLIGIPAESDPKQTLVAATPDTVAKLIKLGYEVAVAHDAGKRSSYPDFLYEKAGAHIVDPEKVWEADIILSVDKPNDDDLGHINPGTTLITRISPRMHPEIADFLAKKKINALAIDAVPRISRAQSMDVLSSMANIGGYRAVIEAANVFGRLFTGQVTAAGKMPPATVYVIGAGVAGLAALGTANSMGAIVKASDIRPEVAEQVESMGGQFVPITEESTRSADGYAREMSESQAQIALKVYADQCAQADIVITTAQIPGKPAPILITKETVATMKPGSVIVDLAASPEGGNCELTQYDTIVRTDNDVSIIGYSNLFSRLPAQASQLYSQNLVNLLKLLTPENNGNIHFNLDDEIIRSIVLSLDGAVLWPPPEISVSVKPKAQSNNLATNKKEENNPSGLSSTPQETPISSPGVNKLAKSKKQIFWTVAGILIISALIFVSPASVQNNFIILALSMVVGYYVITNVTHSIHTPLMSETNAISGIILVGALAMLPLTTNALVLVLCAIAIFVASLNVFGGFYVTHRMLAMFKKER